MLSIVCHMFILILSRSSLMLHVYVLDSGCVSVAFYASANLVAGWMLFFSLSVHQCVPNNVLNSIGCVSPNLQYWCILGYRWACQVLLSKSLISGSQWVQHAGLVIAILDWILPDFQHWCILGRGWIRLMQRSRTQQDRGPSWRRHTELAAVRGFLVCSL